MTASSTGTAVRRVVIYILLTVVVIVAASGIAGLLGRLLDFRPVLGGSDTADLAQSLAFTLVGGLFAAILWRYVWSRQREPSERASNEWGLYVALISLVSLVVFTTSLLSGAAALVDGRWLPFETANGIVWLAVWAWHRWMARHPAKGPLELTKVAPILSSVFGLILTAIWLVRSIALVLDQAIIGLTGAEYIGSTWWQQLAQGLIWAVGGILIWWWHWYRNGARKEEGTLASLMLVGVGILVASIVALGGLGVSVFVLERLVFDRTDPLVQLLSPLGTALAAAGVGAIVFTYHLPIVRARDERVGEAAYLLLSAVGLAAAASGIGVVINAMLAALAPALAGGNARTLLLGGLSSLIVGAPVWLLAWRPWHRPSARLLSSTGRRVFLIVIFGVSAIVALITLLVIGYRVFEFLLDDLTGGSLVDRVRAPLGLLVATALVAGYHFATWRRDRAELAEIEPQHRRTIGHVTLVTSGPAEPQSRTIRDATGASVRVLLRRAEEPVLQGPSEESITQALDGVSAEHALVIVGDGTVEVIPLA